MEITLKATVDLSERLYTTLDRLINALEGPQAKKAVSANLKAPILANVPEVNETQKDIEKAALYAAKVPELELSPATEEPKTGALTGEDVRKAVNSVRERIIGKDWEEQRQNGGERHDRYWTTITTAIKQLANRFGVTTAKAVPPAERSKFILMLDNIGLDDKGNVVINAPY